MESSIPFGYQLILNAIYNGIVAINTQGLIIYFNKMAEKIFNLPAHEAMGIIF